MLLNVDEVINVYNIIYTIEEIEETTMILVKYVKAIVQYYYSGMHMECASEMRA